MEKKPFLQRPGVQTVFASLISILIGLVVGAIVIVVVGLVEGFDGQSIGEGVSLVVGGLFSTGRDAAGSLTWGFNGASFGNMLFRATLPAILRSPINSGAIAMLAGFIIVPVVSWLSKAPDRRFTDALFACYERPRQVTAKTDLGE